LDYDILRDARVLDLGIPTIRIPNPIIQNKPTRKKLVKYITRLLYLICEYKALLASEKEFRKILSRKYRTTYSKSIDYIKDYKAKIFGDIKILGYSLNKDFNIGIDNLNIDYINYGKLLTD